MFYSAVSNINFLSVCERLAQQTREHMSTFTTPGIHIQNIPISDDLREETNAVLASVGVSELLNILAFKRTGGVVSPNSCHVDGNPARVCNCSVVIPVDNTAGTLHYWYTGEFELVEADQLNTQSKTKYYKVKWATEQAPTFAQAVEITFPTLTRTNIPHGVTGRDDKHRLSCTIRFKNNETFEELFRKLCVTI